MTFASLWTLVLVPLWLVLFVRFVRTQSQALRWIGEHVGPRFRRRLTTWSQSSARWHLAFLALLVLLLAVAATGPGWLTGEAKVTDAGRLLIAVDASVSMVAADISVRGSDAPLQRFSVAKELAADLALHLADWDVGLASWSGVGTVHLPLQPDESLTASAARGLGIHNTYRSSGSSFESILDVALRFHDPEENALQVLLITDGEMPKAELYDEALEALVEAGVVVHGLGLGGTEPVGMVVYDPKDLVKPVEERGVLKEFHTRRVDEHLRKITRLTGGHYMVPDLENIQGGETPTVEFAERWATWLRDVKVYAGADQRERAKRDLTSWLLATVLVGCLLDWHLLGRGRGGTPTFELEAIGRRVKTSPATTTAATLLALIALLSVGCSQEGPLWDSFGGKVWKAHRANEKGNRQSVLGRHDAAETHFLRSAAFEIDPEIPTYNHARSRALAEDFARAHELNEKALELHPYLDEARFNDGVVLYRWGVAEAHPQGCELDRTLDLWESALRRFDDVAQSAENPDLGQRAKKQAEAVRREKARLEKLVLDPPGCCDEGESDSESESESEDDSDGDGGGGGGGGGDQDEDDPQEPPPSEPPPASEPPPGQPPLGPGEPPPGQGGGLSDSELEEILAALERIRGQSVGEGKYHHRSTAEQLDEESIGDPEEVWW